MMKKHRLVTLAAGAAAVSLLATGCGGSAGESADGPGSAVAGDVPSWCGPDAENISVALAEGLGGGSWRLLAVAEAKDELSKCPAVGEFLYSDAQGDTQAAISDIQSYAAQGIEAMVVFPDAGEAMLPAIRSAHQAGVAVVPYRVSPGGEPGQDYVDFVETDFAETGQFWGKFLDENLPDGGNVLFLGGPAANSQDLATLEGMKAALGERDDIKLIGDEPFSVTNWDAAETQRVMSAMLSRYDQIDAVVLDFAATSVLTAFEQAGREIPLIATQEVNGLSCAWKDLKEDNPDFEIMTVDNMTWMVRTAVQLAVAEATGGEKPDPYVPGLAFENSVTGEPNNPICEEDMPADFFNSPHLPKDKILEAIQG